MRLSGMTGNCESHGASPIPATLNDGVRGTAVNGWSRAWRSATGAGSWGLNVASSRKNGVVAVAMKSVACWVKTSGRKSVVVDP